MNESSLTLSIARYYFQLCYSLTYNAFVIWFFYLCQLNLILPLFGSKVRVCLDGGFWRSLFFFSELRKLYNVFRIELSETECYMIMYYVILSKTIKISIIYQNIDLALQNPLYKHTLNLKYLNRECCMKKLEQWFIETTWF